MQCAVWLYYRFNLSYRDIETLLAEKGILVSYEVIRLWCNKFGPIYSRRLRHNHQGLGDTFFSDEVFVRIPGKQCYLWRAMDQDGEVVDVLLQSRRNAKAAKRLFRHLIRRNDGPDRKIVTDKWCSYQGAHREPIPGSIHDTSQYANNRAELSHQPIRVRERGMRRFKSVSSAQRFLSTHAAVYNLFNLGCHHLSAKNFRQFRLQVFASWKSAATA